MPRTLERDVWHEVIETHRRIHPDHGDWEPIHHGPIYCSPGCGCQCTREKYELTVRRAMALCAVLGEGWEPRVHENGGWHYSARSTCERLSVSEYWPRQRDNPSAVDALAALVPSYYSAFMNFPGQLPAGHWTAEGATPHEAVTAVVRRAQRDRDEHIQVVDGLEHWLTRLAAEPPPGRFGGY